MTADAPPISKRSEPAAVVTVSFGQAVARVFDLSFGQMLWSRRTIFMAIILLVPIMLALGIRIADAMGGLERLKGVRGVTTFGVIVWWLYLRFVVPMLGAFYGTSLIADEVEDRTITYLFTRPVPKRAILLGKYAAYLACTVLMVLPSLTVVFFLMVPLREIGAAFPMLATDLALLASGLAVYGGVFALVGTATRWPLVIGLVFAFGWEQVAMVMSGYVRRFTVVYWLQGLVPHAIPSEELTSLLAPIINEAPDAWTCVISLAMALVVSLAVAMFVVERREYVLRQ